MQVCGCCRHPPSGRQRARPAHTASAPRPVRSGGWHPHRPRRPHLRRAPRGGPPVPARTHHRAERDGGVAVGLQVLLAEGLHHVGARLQEELSELLANQVVAAVPQELAGVVVGNQDLRVAGEEPASPAAPLTPRNGDGGAGTGQGGPEAQPHPGRVGRRAAGGPPDRPRLHGAERTASEGHVVDRHRRQGGDLPRASCPS